MKLDDVVGAIPVHMFAGIFGTLVVPISNPDTSFLIQFLVLDLFVYLYF
jgi:Amt family ammonium transporter